MLTAAGCTLSLPLPPPCPPPRLLLLPSPSRSVLLCNQISRTNSIIPTPGKDTLDWPNAAGARTVLSNSRSLGGSGILIHWKQRRKAEEAERQRGRGGEASTEEEEETKEAGRSIQAAE